MKNQQRSLDFYWNINSEAHSVTHGSEQEGRLRMQIMSGQLGCVISGVIIQLLRGHAW